MTTRWQATLAAALLLPASALAGQDLTLDELPDPVRQTVMAEVGDAQIHDIERDDDGREPHYEVEFEADGVEYELDVAPDGTLLNRHRD